MDFWVDFTCPIYLFLLSKSKINDFVASFGAKLLFLSNLLNPFLVGC